MKKLYTEILKLEYFSEVEFIDISTSIPYFLREKEKLTKEGEILFSYFKEFLVLDFHSKSKLYIFYSTKKHTGKLLYYNYIMISDLIPLNTKAKFIFFDQFQILFNTIHFSNKLSSFDTFIKHIYPFNLNLKQIEKILIKGHSTSNLNNLAQMLLKSTGGHWALIYDLIAQGDVIKIKNKKFRHISNLIKKTKSYSQIRELLIEYPILCHIAIKFKNERLILQKDINKQLFQKLIDFGIINTQNSQDWSLCSGVIEELIVERTVLDIKGIFAFTLDPKNIEKTNAITDAVKIKTVSKNHNIKFQSTPNNLFNETPKKKEKQCNLIHYVGKYDKDEKHFICVDPKMNSLSINEDKMLNYLRQSFDEIRLLFLNTCNSSDLGESYSKKLSCFVLTIKDITYIEESTPFVENFYTNLFTTRNIVKSFYDSAESLENASILLKVELWFNGHKI